MRQLVERGRRVADISRPDLFKITGLTGGGLLANSLGFDLKPAYAASRQLKISNAKEFKTVCPYCARSDRNGRPTVYAHLRGRG